MTLNLAIQVLKKFRGTIKLDTRVSQALDIVLSEFDFLTGHDPLCPNCGEDMVPADRGLICLYCGKEEIENALS